MSAWGTIFSLFSRHRKPVKPPVPMPLPIHAFDISNFWVDSPVSDDQAYGMMLLARADGQSGVMCGTHIPSVTNQQIKAALKVGLWADIFIFAEWDWAVMRTLCDQAMNAVSDVLPQLGVVWLDCEATPPADWSQVDVKAAISAYVSYLFGLGFRVGIYTRKQWWETYVGNTNGWNHLILWCVDIDNPPPFNAAWWATHAFGGWAAPTWVQYVFDRPVFGMKADLSQRYAA